MRTLYADCFSGISGDMILGALLDIGLDEQAWLAELHKVGAERFEISISTVEKSSITGKKVDVHVVGVSSGHGTHLGDILDLLRASGISESAQRRAAGVFNRLADAEAMIHGVDRNRIHFHEVGADDAIADIVGACLGFEMLGVDSILCSSLPFARGWAKCEHGIIPTPAPATLNLLHGFRWHDDPRNVELITPTGAAILAEFVMRDASGAAITPPPFVLRRSGYGAGSRESERPNLLRLCLVDI